MTQTGADTDRSTAPWPSSSIVAELAEIGKIRAEAMLALHADLCKHHQQMSEQLAVRARSEINLASELVRKLTSARSVPETATAYQEWANQRMQMAVEDGQRLFANGLDLMQRSARILSSGGTGSPI